MSAVGCLTDSVGSVELQIMSNQVRPGCAVALSLVGESAYRFKKTDDEHGRRPLSAATYVATSVSFSQPRRFDQPSVR